MSSCLDTCESPQRRPLTRALISVYDKTNLLPLAQALTNAGVEIVSTGSTAACIAQAGIPVTPVDSITGFPECLEGRVKTLHPHIHAGILADQRKNTHREQLAELGVAAFDLVICNLYPFAQTVASGASFDDCVEQIDIGGPSMLRAAAKNHPSVAVVTSPERYEKVIAAAQSGQGFTLEERRQLAAEAFVHTALYDLAISGWFAEELNCAELIEKLDLACEERIEAADAAFFASLMTAGIEGECFASEDEGDALAEPIFPFVIVESFERVDSLRYGENPHQNAAVYRLFGAEGFCTAEGEFLEEGEGRNEDTLLPGIANARQLHGKAMSYNNYTDADAAIRAAYDHERPCVAIIKHANPCGIAVADTIAEAHRKAHACDPVSAFGGVIATNRPVSVELAQQIAPIFTEVVLAPAYEEGALDVLSAKKNLRVLEVLPLQGPQIELKHISGGLLVQDRDNIDAFGDDPNHWTLVCGEPADAQTLSDLEFAWRTVRAVRSNAVLLVKDGASVGVGMGQVNRVDSCALAVQRANTLGGRATGDAAKKEHTKNDAVHAASEDITSAGGARAEDICEALPERRSEGSVAASDAFFPFADGLQVLIDAGVKAVVQPGGSIRDEESIAAARSAGITMYFTQTRHFAH